MRGRLSAGVSLEALERDPSDSGYDMDSYIV